MMVLENLSYRSKTPLAFSFIILVTAFLVSIALIVQGARQAKQEFIANAESLGRLLVRTVTPAMQHDDLWQAYEILVTPLEQGESAGRSFILLDAKLRVFAASDPGTFPVLSSAEPLRLPGRFDRPTQWEDTAGFFVLSTPVHSEDGVQIGTLVQRYASALLAPRYQQIVRDVALSTLLALTVLLPLGWLAGKRLAGPLSHLAGCLSRVGREAPETIECRYFSGRDEIGQLSSGFRRMLNELQQKQSLEKEVVAADRLAAIGRLTAGIAHEINNPLGGMLNALNTHKKHARPDPQSAKTLSLIERGLIQIRETVSALLAEVRLESHALTPQDIKDIRTLIAPDVQQRDARLVWEVEMTEPLPLPATQVRQILLNLLLNAAKAVRAGGFVRCRLEVIGGACVICVEDEGEAIPPERMAHLFEPFAESRGGHGLGLWVTYQLVTQLGGKIAAQCNDGKTVFDVHLPLDITP